MKKISSAPRSDKKPTAPSEGELKRMLGETYTKYQNILELTAKYPHEWKYYGKKYGWNMKFTDKGKVLLYLTPQENSFRVGFALRDAERKTLLKSKLPSATKEELNSANRYPEGYPLLLDVGRKSDVKSARLVIETLMSMRS